MTAPSLLDELEAVVRLTDKATPGAWSLWGTPTPSQAIQSPDKFVMQTLGGNDVPNAEAVAAAMNFIRTHHAELANMAKRLEAAERKVSRLTAMRNEWERDAREHLMTFGQHLPASVECLVERFDAAIAAAQEGEE